MLDKPLVIKQTISVSIFVCHRDTKGACVGTGKGES